MNPHDRLRSADFKSAVSADFTIRAGGITFNIVPHIQIARAPCRLSAYRTGYNERYISRLRRIA